MTLKAGLAAERDFRVDASLLTDVGGTLGGEVLATPAMIGVMERTAAMLVHPHLEPGYATVGFHVDVRHVRAARAGAACRVRVLLRAIDDGRKLHFDVEVLEAGRTIGVGTHERRIVARRVDP